MLAHKPRRVPGLVLISALVLLLVSAAAANPLRKSFRHESSDRHFFISLPSTYSPQGHHPLLLVFHGGGGNPEQVMQASDLVSRAEREGWILVAPAGSGRLSRILTWNVGFGFGYAGERSVDDIGFVRNLLDVLIASYAIDANRIYATGISNGGILCHLLAGHLSERIAAIAPIAATAGGRAKNQALWTYPPKPQHPVSVLAFNGSQDLSIPLEGGWQKRSFAHDPVEIWSAQQTADFWVEHNRCSRPAFKERNEARKYERHIYQCGTRGTEVVQMILLNQGHAWPGGKKGFRLGDEPSPDVSANELMFEFFNKHPKKQSF
jgi:polyhydroxybutyrate depolymerase